MREPMPQSIDAQPLTRTVIIIMFHVLALSIASGVINVLLTAGLDKHGPHTALGQWLVEEGTTTKLVTDVEAGHRTGTGEGE